MSRAETVVNVSASDIENVVRQVKNIEIGENAVSDGAYSVAVGEFAVTHSNSAIAIGGATANADLSIAIGGNTQVGDNCYDSIAIGNNAFVGDRNTPGVNYAVQLGMGVNLKPNTLQYRDFTVIDENGHLPKDRLADAIPTKVSELENDLKYTTEDDVVAKIGENVPIKNLALSMTENTMLTDIADGCYIIAEGGYIQTTGGSLRALGAGTELIVFTYNDVKSATYQSGKALASFNDNMTASDKLFTWLNTSDKDLQITESATDDTIPTSKAVKEYVDNNTITDYNNLLNQPIKNLDLDANDINNPISLSAIGEGVFIVTSNGYIITKGGYKKVYGKGTELVIVKTNKSGVTTLCMTVQDGATFYRVDDDFSTGSDVIRWLSSNNKTTIIDNDNASKIPTSGAVMNYVTEIVNNSIADVSTLIGTVSENEVVE